MLRARPGRPSIKAGGRKWTHNLNVYLEPLSLGALRLHKGDGETIDYPLTCPVDVNRSGGLIDIVDIQLTAEHWRTPPIGDSFFDVFFDVDQDNDIDSVDIGRVTAAFDRSCADVDLANSWWTGYNASGVYSRLVRDPAGPQLRMRDGLIYQFRPLDSPVAPGFLARVNDRSGNGYQLNYALSSGRLDSAQSTSGMQLLFAYNPNGTIQRVQDHTGRQVLYTYDGGNNLTQVQRYGQPWHAYTYDPSSLLVTDTDANGGSTNYTYDGMSRVITLQRPAVVTPQTYAYLPGDTLVTDPLGRGTQVQFNPTNSQVTQVTQLATGMAIAYARDTHGNLAHLGGGEGNDYEYDSRGNLVRIASAHPDPAVPTRLQTVVTYDACNNQVSITDAMGAVTQNVYNPTTCQLQQSIDPLGQVTTFVNNARGQPLHITDALGRTSHNGYDALGNLTQTTNPAGSTTMMMYDGLNRKVGEIDPLGQVTTFEYDPFDRQVKIIAPGSATTLMVYDVIGNLLRVTDPDEAMTEYTYDARGNKTSAKDAMGNLTTYQYDGANRLVQTTDPGGKVTQVTYDAQDRVVKVQGPLGQTTQIAYDDPANTRTVTNTLGVTTTFTLDRIGRVTQVATAAGPSTVYEYDVAGNLLSVTDPLSRTETFTYDAAGHKLSETNALGHTTSYSYDAVGNVVALTNARGNTTSFMYDHNNRMSAVTDPLGGTTQMLRDAVGRTTSVVNATGQTTQFVYDPQGHLVAVTNGAGETTQIEYSPAGKQTAMVAPSGGRIDLTLDPLGRVSQVHEGPTVTSYSYDTSGHRTSMVDANGQTWLYAYDDLGRLSSTTDPLGRVTAYQYDLLGNLTAKLLPNATAIQYTYDSMNRIVRTDYPGGSYDTQVYDAAGNVTEATSRSSGGAIIGKTSFTYDARNQIVQTSIQVAPALNAAIGYQYDAVGNPVQKTYSLPGLSTPAQVVQVWDANNRLSKATRTDNAGALVTTQEKTYDAEGRETQSLLKKGVTPAAFVYHTYDAAGRVTQIRNCADAGCTNEISRFAYTYDVNGNRLSEQIREGNGTQQQHIQYTYDSFNRLVRETRQPISPPGPPSYDYWYQYDNVGNRVQREDRSVGGCIPNVTCPRTVTTYDGAHQTAQEMHFAAGGGPPSQIVAHMYDPMGRLVQRQAVSGTPLGEQFAYTGADQQAVYTNALTSQTRTYSYDALGNQVLACGPAPGACTGYLYDGPNVVAEYSSATLTPVLKATYLFGQEIDAQVARIDPTANTVHFYLRDALGSTRQIIDQASAAVNDYEYEAFGKIFTQVTGLPNDILFAGRRLDPLSGLYEFRTRTYDPADGRFLQTDPIYQGVILAACSACWQNPLELWSVMPLYAYVGNNPATYTDPTGEQWWFWHPWWWTTGLWTYYPYHWWGWWYGPWGWFGLRWWWWRWWWPANPWWGGWWWWQWRWWWGGYWFGWWGHFGWTWWWWNFHWWWWPWWFGWGWWWWPWWWGGWWWPWWWFKWRGWWHWWWDWPFKWTWWCGWWWRWWWPWWWGGFWWPWWWVSWGGWLFPWWLGWGWWWWPWWWGGFWWPWWFSWGWWPWWGGQFWWPWWWPWRAWWWGTWWWGSWYWWTGWYWWPWWWGGWWWPWWWHCWWSLRPWWWGINWVWWGWWRPWWRWWWWRSWWWWPSRGWWWWPLWNYGGTPMGDLGDAPDSSNHYGVAMTAYTGPPTVNASYPTVYDPGLGAPYGPLHRYPYADAWLGTSVATERDADLLPDADGWTNIDPSNNFSNRDNYDDGVNTGAINLVHCTPTTVTFVVNVQSLATRTRYVNIWFDWDRDGDWGDTPNCGASLGPAPEWAVQNYAFTLGPGVHTLITPAFLVYDPLDRAHWMRITLSEQPRPSGAAGEGPAGGYQYGETEDYVVN